VGELKGYLEEVGARLPAELLSELAAVERRLG
jgi:hypothetical protein